MDNIALTKGYNCSINKVNNDIVITFNRLNSIYNVRIGTGGTIGNIKTNTGDELLSPAFRDEKTDRIIQWTIWSNNVRYEIENFADYEKRYNLTQGGDESGKFSVTKYINIYNNGVDVWSSPNVNWKIKLQNHLTGGVDCLSRYRIIGDGILLIRRVIYIKSVYKDGKESELCNSYIENWTPINRKLYNSCALDVDDNNKPLWWYSAGNNLPVYPNFKATDTNGYCIGYDTNNIESGEAIGVVFGKSDLEITKYKNNVDGNHVLNTMPWDTGFGILPGINVNNLECGDVIDTHLILVMNKGITTNFMNTIKDCVKGIPSPRLYKRYSTMNNDIMFIIHCLMVLDQYKTEYRTDNLGILWQ